MTNFDFLKDDPQFSGFADAAIAAERILPIDAATAVLDCRRAMEFAVKWMYSVDSSLVKPWDDKLISLMSTEEFHDIVDDDLWRRMDFIRKRGNDAAHGSRSIRREQAELCLENLFLFLDFVAYCYGTSYQEKKFDASLLTQQPAAPVAQPALPDVDLDALIKENAELKAQLTARRETQQPTYVPKPLELSEYKTRKLYIDSMLTDAGWVEGKNWVNEVPLPGMPNKSGIGYADYVLYGDDGRALAVIEAKRTCKDVAVGRQQAKLYADILEKQFGRRPVVFLTNGFDTRIVDNIYPERKVASIYSKRDLEKWFNLQAMRTSRQCGCKQKHCRTVLSGGCHQGCLRQFWPQEPPESPARHGNRLRQDPYRHCTGGCIIAAWLGQKRAVFGRPQQPCDAGKAQLCQPPAGAFRDEPLRGQRQLYGTLRVLNLSDHDELH